MTYASFKPNVIKLSVFLVIVLHGSSITVVRADVRAIANTTGYHVTVRSEASSLSSIPAARYASTNPNTQWSYENDNTSVMASLVEAPVKVISPRTVESEIREKLDRKRESGTGMQGTNQRDSGYDNGNHACVLNDDGELRESSYKLYNGKTGTDVMRIVRTSPNRDASTGVHDRNIIYDEDQESAGGSDVTDDEDDQNDDDGDDGFDDEDSVVVDDDKARQNRKRKAGRRYRDGPKIWDQWGKWTSCSVSCGAGKLTRWRHCVAGGCSVGEKEAQLKTCTFSAC